MNSWRHTTDRSPAASWGPAACERMLATAVGQWSAEPLMPAPAAQLDSGNGPLSSVPPGPCAAGRRIGIALSWLSLAIAQWIFSGSLGLLQLFSWDTGLVSVRFHELTEPCELLRSFSSSSFGARFCSLLPPRCLGCSSECLWSTY